MIDELGESGKLVVTFARRAAEEHGSESLGTEHLLLGIADLEDVRIRRLFQAGGVDLDEACAALRERMRGDASASVVAPSPGLVHALDVAKEEAARHGQALVEAPHILLGVLHDDEGLAAALLRERGADLTDLAAAVTGMLEQGTWTPEGFYRERRTIEQPALGSTASVLESLGRDLTEEAARGELSPLIGRERELVELTQVLLGKRKNNAVLIGDAGVGKTAIVEGLAQRIVQAQVPDQLKGMRIRTIEVGSLVAGTIYRGQFEGRLKELIDEVRERPDVILFIDEMHMLIGAGEAGQGSMDAANMLKPVLSEGKLKVIGATTTDEFRKYIERDTALMRRFQPITVEEPAREEALRILAGLRDKYQEFHGVKIEDEALAAAVDLSMRHIHDRFLPDKALDLLDRACTQTKLGAGMAEWMPGLAPRSSDLVVDESDIAEVVSVLLEIPIARLTSDERQRLGEMVGTLKARVRGQDEAVEAVAKAVLSSRVGMGDPDRPLGVFLFLGPTGVGKTKLAEEVAAFLFGDKDELVRIDMSEYIEKHTVSRLVGAPPGYVGFEEGGALTNAVLAKPYAVVLLDEVEKAHPDVWNIFLQVLDDGRLTDSRGSLVDFRQTLIIMTSNVGTRQIQASRPIGFTQGTEDAREIPYDDIRREVAKELERVFPKEFLNRIDEVLVFKPLSKDDLRTIVGLLVKEMIPLDLELSEDALEYLVEQSYDPSMGARPARRAIQRLLRNPLSLMLAQEEISGVDTVAVELDDGALRFARKAGRREPVEARS